MVPAPYWQGEGGFLWVIAGRPSTGMDLVAEDTLEKGGPEKGSHPGLLSRPQNSCVHIPCWDQLSSQSPNLLVGIRNLITQKMWKPPSSPTSRPCFSSLDLDFGVKPLISRLPSRLRLGH